MSGNYSFAELYFWDLAVQIPLLTVYIVGIVLVAVNWRTHPRPSRLAFLGIIALIFNALIVTLVIRWVSYYEAHSLAWNTRIGYMFWSIVRCAISAVGLCLILFAVYTARLPQAARRAERVRDFDFPFDQPPRRLPEAVPVDDPDTSIRERKKQSEM
ncbi:MAG TPA: hypothetical protein VKS79_23200 [Gemmataceae bacterium]|nr:hypothetical protein [Gemmataceae bacterium]